MFRSDVGVEAVSKGVVKRANVSARTPACLENGYIVAALV